MSWFWNGSQWCFCVDTPHVTAALSKWQTNHVPDATPPSHLLSQTTHYVKSWLQQFWISQSILFVQSWILRHRLWTKSRYVHRFNESTINHAGRGELWYFLNIKYSKKETDAGVFTYLVPDFVHTDSWLQDHVWLADSLSNVLFYIQSWTQNAQFKSSNTLTTLSRERQELR